MRGEKPGLTVVFARCSERGAVRELRAAGVPFLVYQKRPCNHTRGAKIMEELSSAVRWMPHNRGDECSAYLQYIADEYDALPPAVAFMQFGSEQQQLLSTVLKTAQLAAESVQRLGFVALGRHSFEGAWPAPCEASGKQRTFRRCSERFWSDDLGVTPPRAFRFYANGLFAVTRERIRRRPKRFYATLAARLAGETPSRCDGPDTRAMKGAASRLVGDCHVLEKSWHVLFGEGPTLPTPREYGPLRSPRIATRPGGRFYEVEAGGRCLANSTLAS